MNLTNEQLKALEKGQIVPVVIDHTECVVIRKDVYEMVNDVVDDLTDGEITALATQAFDEADIAGPIECSAERCI